ncbi:MAG: hypothetical protein CSA07_03725 [Bacteroidia bacterium]|nr:MAG: hypothetical protein CSA07_03725 [Bacteroidia bacterium]
MLRAPFLHFFPLLLIVALLASCGGRTQPGADQPLQGDTVAEDTPVLYHAYAKRDSMPVYEFPSADSAVLAKREAYDRLEVIGEREGGWLEVMMRITRYYDLNSAVQEEREQLERLYVQRGDVLLREEIVLSEGDFRGSLLAYCIGGERFDRPREVDMGEYARVELISEEEFEQAREKRATRGKLGWHPGARRAGEEVFVPLDGRRYIRAESGRGERAGAAETRRTRALMDSLRAVGAERVLTLDTLMTREVQMAGNGIVLEVCGNEYGWGSEGHVHDEGCGCEECAAGGAGAPYFYMGELRSAGFMVFERAYDAQSEVVFLSRRPGRKAYSFVGIGDELPVVLPDSTRVVGIGSRWYHASWAVLTVLRLSPEGGQVALELGFPQMEFLLMGHGDASVFMADGAVYARVFSKRVVNRPLDFAQYVRIHLNKK